MVAAGFFWRRNQVEAVGFGAGLPGDGGGGAGEDLPVEI